MQVLNENRVRVNPVMLSFLKEEIGKIDPNAHIYVFGSRADLSKKGGDIDLLILSEEKLPVVALNKIKDVFCRAFGEQKLDLVNFTFDEDATFKKLALLDAIRI